ncbi:ScbA/BarX family gamma-butyrolactone biosynthesis protein [Streptomyces spongiicola]|uniref:ScbA/BarX family gamma-butyrolactone biosynthesis protein n=1 Tax=Streptomyces spongiicola TaxID=1690221 RepID=UPI0033DE6176
MHSSAHTDLRTSDLQRLARKASPGEVFVRDWREESPQTHVVALGWPRSHAFYTLRSGATSPLLFVEAVRQALAVLSHTAQEIPLDHRLGRDSARCTFAPAAFRERRAPTDVELRVRHSGVTRRRLGSVRLTACIEATCGGEVLGCAEIGYATHPPVIYDRLRGTYAHAQQSFAAALPPARPVTPALVDRTHPGDVVIACTSKAHHYQLRTDTSNSVLFDHPHDHVPGIVLLEAVVQAVHASAPGHARLASLDTAFLRYVEFDMPCWVDVAPGPPDAQGGSRLLVTGTQNGRKAFSSTLAFDSPTTSLEPAVPAGPERLGAGPTPAACPAG